MAERRMFAKTIVLSDDFLDMPMSARCLYFTLGMLADDDGFINSPKSIMRQCGATADDMRILLGKRFLLQFDTGVIVIKHWRMNNYLQNDRHKDTEYQEELSQLTVKKNGAYTMDTKCIQDVYRTDTQVSIGKESIGKDSSVNKGRFTPPSVEEVAEYVNEKGYHFDPEQFVSFYSSKGWKVGSQPMKDWHAACVTWEGRWKQNHANEPPKPPKRNARPAETHDYDFDDIETMLLRKQKEWK